MYEFDVMPTESLTVLVFLNFYVVIFIKNNWHYIILLWARKKPGLKKSQSQAKNVILIIAF